MTSTGNAVGMEPPLGDEVNHEIERLSASLRHSVEREAALREALEPFADCTKYTGEHDGDDEHPSWSPFIPVSAYRKARAALDRRAEDA